jgi:hypothetical protein
MKIRKAIAVCVCCLVLVLLAGCQSKLTHGEVIDKSFTAAYTETKLMPHVMCSGKTCTTTLIPYTVHHPDNWTITIKSVADDDRYGETAKYCVTQNVYDSVNIGDMFEYDKDTCWDKEKATKERTEER